MALLPGRSPGLNLYSQAYLQAHLPIKTIPPALQLNSLLFLLFRYIESGKIEVE